MHWQSEDAFLLIDAALVTRDNVLSINTFPINTIAKTDLLFGPFLERHSLLIQKLL